MKMRDWEGALKDMKRSYICSINAEDRQGAALSVCDMLEISLKRGDMASALSYLKGLIPFLHGDERCNEIAWSYLEGIHSLEGVKIPERLEEGIDHSLRILIGSENPRNLIRGLEKFRGGKNREIIHRTFLKTADLLRKKEEFHASVVVSLWLAEDLIDAGENKRPSKLIKRARKDASKIDFTKAIKRSDELLRRME